MRAQAPAAMQGDVDLFTVDEVVAIMNARPHSQRCKTCRAPNRHDTEPPHKKVKKGEEGCPFNTPAHAIGRAAADELVSMMTRPRNQRLLAHPSDPLYVGDSIGR